MNNFYCDVIEFSGTIPTEKRDRYLWVYGVLGVGQAVFIFMGSTVMAICTLKSSNAFHSEMLNRVMRCPMFFFDITPIGRIVNRFAKGLFKIKNMEKGESIKILMIFIVF